MKLIADSGSTKTDWALVAARDDVAFVHTQGINPFHQSKAAIADILKAELLPNLDASKVTEVYF